MVTVEDGVLKGGMGSAILEFMADNEYNPQIKRIGLPDQFVIGTLHERRIDIAERQ